ncbi:MAG: hypothetical protein PHV68_00085 [Candidatus Gastranaerophilales bacterium]|nr:hypothetical protein [Candidatus Gastranaerophilales bacterium]
MSIKRKEKKKPGLIVTFSDEPVTPEARKKALGKNPPVKCTKRLLKEEQ